MPNPQELAWVEQLRRAGPVLARIRASELAATDSRLVAAQLEDASRAAFASRPRTVTSGLVEQQKYFHHRRDLAQDLFR